MSKPSFHNRKNLLFLLAIGSPIAFGTWQALLNNFAVETAAFSGEEIGILQSLREVPGFMAFTAIFVLLFLRQQNFAILSMLVLGIGTAITAFFPSVLWLYFATVLMSTGFHYLETMQTSLSLQWLSKEEAPAVMGQILSARSMATFAVLGILYICLLFFETNYLWIYLLAGSVCAAIGVYCWFFFPHFRPGNSEKRIVPTKKILALLRPHVPGRCQKTNFYRLRGISSGGKIQLPGRANGTADPD